MKAQVLEQLGQPLQLQELTIPPLQKGQVLVKIAYSGVCHSQLMEARGRRGKDEYLPHLLGHEATGVVKDIGDSVDKVMVGDRVVLGWIKGEGIESSAIHFSNKHNHCINAGKVTTFSEYTVVSENRLVKLPCDIPMDVGVLFGCAIPTGAGMVMNEINPTKNDCIAIFGLGGIGLSALMATNIFDCQDIISIDIEDSKLKLAQKFGATQTINASCYNSDEIIKQIKIMTNDEGVDYAIDASGLVQVIELAFKVIKNSGLCLFASHPKAGDKIALDPFDLICGKRIKGSWGGACLPDRDLPILFDLYREGNLPLRDLFDKVYYLEDVNQALDDLDNRVAIRPLIVIDDSLE